jgi:hypothetical protein
MKVNGTFERYQEPWLILGDPRGASYVLQGKNYVRPDSDRLFLKLLVSLYIDITVFKFKLTDSISLAKAFSVLKVRSESRI